MTAFDAVKLPPAYGLRTLSERERAQMTETEDLEDHLLIWEAPARGHKYVIGVDVSDGLGQNRSVIDVLRVGTIEEPDEQVAQYVSRWVDPVDLAYLIDPVGRFYRDDDGFEALVAVETNNHGVATQAELARHLGYANFFIWQKEDAAPGTNRYTTAIGWVTTSRTRPIILSRYHKMVKSVDPVTGLSDYRINSPFTMAELKDFQTEGMLWEAEASAGATDDCIMAGAIACHVAQTMHHEESEPVSEQRHRLAQERERSSEFEDALRTRRDFQNTDTTIGELDGESEFDGWSGAQDFE